MNELLQIDRPDVTLENAPAVYAYALNALPNRDPAAVDRAYRIMSLLVSPRVSFDPGVDEALEAAHDDEDVRVIFIGHHVYYQEPIALAAAVHNHSWLQPYAYDTAMLSKPAPFNWPYPQAVRTLVENIGALPAWRPKDVKKSKHPEAKALAAIAGKRLLSTTTKLIENESMNIALYPPGTRTETPEEVPEFERGLGIIAAKAARKNKVLVAHIGIAYPHPASRKPHMHFGTPYIVARKQSPDSIARVTRAQLQQATNEARRRRSLPILGENDPLG